ncbi:MAG: translation elongation factor 4 [Dehalococcoidia bacterium]
MNADLIRNFCIIAHIDHGKSTLADRLIEFTKGKKEEKDQVLDTMDLERERGITIKSQAISLPYKSDSGLTYNLNLIDTPGHVDFASEVSRSLRSSDGAILLVDATQGIQAQTIANTYLAIDLGLNIIPVINKIDLPSSQTKIVTEELISTFGFMEDEIFHCSAKTGEGVTSLLEKIIENIPSPQGESKITRALVFDSKYDQYKGIINYVRIFDGEIKAGDNLKTYNSKNNFIASEVGIFTPEQTKKESLTYGEVGYVYTGLKEFKNLPVGETIFNSENDNIEPLISNQELKPKVFAGMFPLDANDFIDLEEALSKLQLNDASIIYSRETSQALGPGFRCGFLGVLHMEIIQERVEREYGIDIIMTAPSVEYKIKLKNKETILINNPSAVDLSEIEYIEEPWIKSTIICPDKFIGKIMDLITSRRGTSSNIEYLNSTGNESNISRVLISFEMPLGEILVGFYDQLKSVTQGYGSIDYEIIGFKKSNLAKVDILINQDKVDSLSTFISKEKSYYYGRELVSKLKELIPRQLFEVPIQAAIGSKVIARDNVKALRKNVTAKCYGGDITRKKKLLAKQAEGKKRLKKLGRVEIPQEAFLSILNIDR